LLAVVGLLYAVFTAGESMAQSLTRGPYLQLGTPTSIIVRWRTNVSTNSRVRYGTELGNLTSMVDQATLTTEHEVTLTGLTPNTRYYYAVGTSTQTLAGDDPTHVFRTSPPAGTVKPTRIWVLGDSGEANANARAVRDAYVAFTGNTPTDLWLMLGDNAYDNGTDAEYQAAVFDMYPTMLKTAVLWPTLGNHDGVSADSSTQTGPYYQMFTLPTQGEAGGLASGTEAYYAFDYGNIHFVCLDSHDTDRSPDGAMMTWLANDLAITDKEWIIAFWHHPPYSKGSHDSDTESRLVEMRQHALPILEAYGVDLVLSGHSHSYERSFLLDGHYGPSSTLTPGMILDAGDGREAGDGPYTKTAGGAPNDGAVYVVSGSSSKVSSGTWNHPVMYIALATLGSLVLDVNGNRLDAIFLDATGAVGDSFTILKGPDTFPPTVIAAAVVGGNTTVHVTFSERVDPASAQNSANYALDYAASITQVVLAADGRSVMLTTSPLLANLAYTLTIHDVQDVAGNPIAPNTQTSFTFLNQVTTEVQIATGTDDAEERASGSVSLSSSDVELVTDGSNTQTVGLRFAGVAIPPGATIREAYVQFQADETHNQPTTLTIQGQASDHAPSFTSAKWNISSRPRTTAAVPWQPPAWSVAGEAGPAQRTPNLGAILQEVVGRPGWASGNAVGLLITGSGTRVAEAYEGNALGAARLYVTYALAPVEPRPPEPPALVAPANDASNLQLEPTLSWDGTADTFTVDIAAVTDFSVVTYSASQITGTSLTVPAGILYTETTYYWRVQGVNMYGPGEFSSAFAFHTESAPDTTLPGPPQNLSSPSQTSTTVDLAWDAATDDRGVVLYHIYQAGGKIASTASVTFTVTGLLPNTSYDYQVSAKDAAGNESLLSNVLTVSTQNLSAPVTISVQVIASQDDAEEQQSNGKMSLTSSDLEIAQDGSKTQVVGIRFRNVTVPAGAIVQEAHVRFTVDETNSGVTSLEIRAQAADHATVFTSSTRNISSRPTTTAAVNWQPASWDTVGAAGLAQRTPNLSALVQEVVDRGDWISGNALVFVITGSGQRTAESFDGKATAAPKLTITYQSASGG
jgi:chitodextrinase